MNANIVPCPTCSQNGYLTQSGGILLCQTCKGGSGWLQTENGQILRLSLPISAVAEQPLRRILPYVLISVGAIAVILAVTATFSITPFSILNLFWRQGWPDAVFGIGGFLIMIGLTNVQAHHHSSASFAEIGTVPDQQLNPYLSTRIEQFWPMLREITRRLNQESISERVLLIGLLSTGRIQSMISRLEQNVDRLIDILSQGIKPGATKINPVLDPATRQRILRASQITLNSGYPYVDLEDILLTYLDESSEWPGFLEKFDLKADNFRTIADWYAADSSRRAEWQFWLTKGHARPNGYMNRAWTALPTHTLDQFGSDLTSLAASGRLPSISVREAEIQQLLEILGRENHNSAVLVGEAGVGKTTLLGGVALRIIEGNVPPGLLDKRLVLLEVSTLLAQAGNAEQNLEGILEEVEQAGNVILAIPDVHLLAGTSNSALDAASLLGSALNRGTIQLISTARYADYHRYIEQSALLSNALELVEVKEATVEQTIQILESEVPRLEGRHHVAISYPAIKASAELAKRYLPEKILPTSAIDLLDEVASAAELAKKNWVTKDMVTERLTERTGVPIGEATAEQANQLLHLEDELHRSIVGQELAINAVSEAMRRAAAGLHQNNRPLASFLFVGPTGTGKTELARALAALQFKRDDAFLRFDMSEYEAPNALYQLIGAPAASSESFTEGGTLTQAIREHPYSLILFDELEKAHPDVLNLLLQLLDAGRLTENTGRTVQFNNCVIIATSNAGTKDLTAMLQQTTGTEEINKSSLEILQNYFKPELINRFDRIVPFLPLSESEIEQITLIQLNSMAVELAKQQYTVTFAPAIVPILANAGFDPVFGARPLRRAIQDKVEGALSQLILKKELLPGGMVEITPEMIQ